MDPHDTGAWPWGGIRQQRHIAYPEGTIAMQHPLFAQRGLDLSVLARNPQPQRCTTGTRLRDPDHTFPSSLDDLHPPETFSFWRITLRSDVDGEVLAWIYYPHPETKERHHQPRSVVEVVAPRMRGIGPGGDLLLKDSRNRISCVDCVRLRAQLLEFLKFRVLAAQDGFFAESSLTERRNWLRQHHPQALALTIPLCRWSGIVPRAVHRVEPLRRINARLLKICSQVMV